MNKNALTTIAAVLLIIYSLINFGAGIGQFGKAKTVSGTTSLAVSLGNMAGDKAGADQLNRKGTKASAMLYLIALFILVTAALEMTGAIGLFSGRNWAPSLVIAAAICGVLVEIQDCAEDGFGVGKLIFFAINLIAFFAATSAREPVTDIE